MRGEQAACVAWDMGPWGGQRATADRQARGAERARQQIDRRATLNAAPWDGWAVRSTYECRTWDGRTGARQQEGSALYVRSTDVGRTGDAECCLNMGDWQTITSTKKRDTHCGRHVHMVRGAVPWECLQMRKLDR